jgi:hypothetical protein
MTKWKILSIGLFAATMLATPVMAQGVNQEPGGMGFYYPNSRYLTGGYGVRGTPGPGYYYRNPYHQLPRVGAFATAPWDNSYGYYIEPAPRYITGGYGVRGTPGPGYYYRNPYHPIPRVGAFATAPWDDSYGYYIEPETVWVAP